MKLLATNKETGESDYISKTGREVRNVIDLESSVNMCNEFDSFSRILRLRARSCHNRVPKYVSIVCLHQSMFASYFFFYRNVGRRRDGVADGRWRQTASVVEKS